MGLFSQAGPLGWAVLGGIKTAKTGWNLASGGPLKRSLLGAGVGGMIGAAQNTNDPNNRTESISKGALIGGLVGSMGFRKGSIFGNSVPIPAIGRAANILGLSGKGLSKTLAKSALKTTGRAGMFIAENPRTALGIGIGVGAVTGIGMLEGNTSSPTLSPLGSDFNGELNPAYTPEMSQNGVASLTGGTGQIGSGNVVGLGLGQQAKAFQNSTYGLTQGLHRRRHG